MHIFRGTNFIAGFSERKDGNLNFHELSSTEAKLLWESIQTTLGVADLHLPTPRFAHQIHSRLIIPLNSNAPEGAQGKGDALWTSCPLTPIGIFTADCLPILVVADTAVMAIHAGWKGTRDNITGFAISSLAEKTNCSPNRMQVFMGPCIGSCCLEVGEEVVEEFRSINPASLACFSRGKRWHLDLRALNVIQCLERGVPLASIQHVNDCTKCLPEKYFSYRQMKGRNGTQFSFIVRLPE